ncbi:hypothetical protein HII17_00980 [Thalassotalea sp. M1531]|uniref:Glyoxalase/fosfomycin resistance/dioxygenase domain-containing protein n=1 Tax=Thalassotalea algicola TaxID=2716224 RepID=A0A7Y0LAJ5_9GAMM|nr:VOC family protein [Thalassotalea algicola]NMP30121.1 hypothetical protein [Thalassotalea algicola]
MSNRQLGPIVGATLITSDLQHVSKSYQQVLGFNLHAQFQVTEELALLWQSPKLEEANLHVLASSDGNSWLRIVEDNSAKPAMPLKSHGWMSLETNVGNVDSLRKRFTDERFTIIGEPAYLQVSDAIKAMQVIGPAGEVSYLTQIEREVPPFELPMTNAETAGLFIPVLATPDRDKSLDFYQTLNAADQGLKFDTKVSVLNNAWRQELEHQYPVATLQLDGKCLFEIDQVAQASAIVSNENGLPSGIGLITCVTKNIDAIAKRFNSNIHLINDDYYPGTKVLLLKGPAGEFIELVEAS